MTVAPAIGSDHELGAIRERVLAGQRLSLEDGVALYHTRDIFTLGELANLVRERLHGRRAYFNINRHINYSNYCVLRCKFCSFYREYPKQKGSGIGDQGTGMESETKSRGDEETKWKAAGIPAPALTRSPIPDPRSLPLAAAPTQSPLTGAWSSPGYEFSSDQIVAMCREAVDRRATEVHMVGGLHPKLPFEWYLDLLRAIRAACPNLHIKAFTAIEIMHFTRISKPRLSIPEVLTALREAGLDSMPGGGAEIFDDRVHDEAYKAKVGEKHWFDVHRAAHDLGIPTNATMLYGHVETIEERVGHMLKLRAHQDESLARVRDEETKRRRDEVRAADASSTPSLRLSVSPSLSARPAAFNCFIPLSFIPDGSELSRLPGPTGLDDLRTLAVSRLMLDNFPHIKAFWIMQSPKLAQVALNWGVDDFDGTVVWYDITKREGHGTNRQELTVDQISRLMREAGCTPIERDSLYRPVQRDAKGRLVSDVRTPR